MFSAWVPFQEIKEKVVTMPTKKRAEAAGATRVEVEEIRASSEKTVMARIEKSYTLGAMIAQDPQKNKLPWHWNCDESKTKIYIGLKSKRLNRPH